MGNQIRAIVFQCSTGTYLFKEGKVFRVGNRTKITKGIKEHMFIDLELTDLTLNDFDEEVRNYVKERST